MTAYSWLAERLPRTAAAGLAVLWLALLIFLALFFAGEPSADFRYGNL